MTTQATAEWQYEQLLNARNLKRPTNLAKVKIRLRNANGPMPSNPVGWLQSLLDCECVKPDFFDIAGAVPGFRVPDTDNSLAGTADVWLYSTKRCAPEDNWVEVSCTTAGPWLPGTPLC
jgi:hypothetical protein